jgi:hypothetical protein
MARPPEWRSGLRHCITVLEASLQPLVRFQTVSQLAVTRRHMRRCTIGPTSSRLGEGLASCDFLVPLRSSDSLWRAGRLQADLVRQLNSVSLVRLSSGLSEQGVKKQCGLAGLCFGGCMAFDLRLSWVSMGVAVMGQVCNYQLGRKGGYNILLNKKFN